MAEPPEKRPTPEERVPPEIPEVPTEELLREARIAALAFARRRRGVLAARHMAVRYVAYYTSKYARTKAPRDYEKLIEWRGRLAVYEAHYDMLRAAGYYARTRTAENELKLRRAQETYYMARRIVVPEEERRRIETEVLPRLRDEIDRLREELELVVVPPPLPPPEEYTTEKEYKEAVRHQVLEHLCPSYREEATVVVTTLTGPEREKRLRELGYEYFSKMYVGVREAEERAGELWKTRRTE